MGIPPPCRNQREPTAPDTPHATAASSVDSPSAIPAQNARSNSRRIGGLPGDPIEGLPFNVTIHPGCLLIDHLQLGVLRRPVDSAQYTSIRYSERLTDAGAVASIGTVGDSFDNALAETTIGLYKTECVRHEGPWRGADGLELATLNWVWWFNNTRIHSALGYATPIEFENAHYRHINTQPDLVSGEPALH